MYRGGHAKYILQIILKFCDNHGINPRTGRATKEKQKQIDAEKKANELKAAECKAAVDKVDADVSKPWDHVILLQGRCRCVEGQCALHGSEDKGLDDVKENMNDLENMNMKREKKHEKMESSSSVTKQSMAARPKPKAKNAIKKPSMKTSKAKAKAKPVLKTSKAKPKPVLKFRSRSSEAEASTTSTRTSASSEVSSSSASASLSAPATNAGSGLGFYDPRPRFGYSIGPGVVSPPHTMIWEHAGISLNTPEGRKESTQLIEDFGNLRNAQYEVCKLQTKVMGYSKNPRGSVPHGAMEMIVYQWPPHPNDPNRFTEVPLDF
jgi:hypothetical protein